MSECLPSDCSPDESFGFGRLEGRAETNSLAINSASANHQLFALDFEAGQLTTFAVKTVPDATTLRASGFAPGAATLNATVNPSGVELDPGLAGCRFEWAEAGHPYEHQVPCDKSAAQIGSGTSPVSVHAEISGLTAGRSYHFRLVASNPATTLAEEPSRGADVSFGPPLIESGSALHVSATDATLQAQVNPNNVDTHARIEYVTQADFEAHGFSESATTREADLGPAGSTQSASFDIAGLEATTTYRYRVLAENVLGAVEGPELTFTTQGATAASLLPDDRGWELVSPPDKHGSPIEPLSGSIGEGGIVQAAADGSALTYIAHGSITSAPPANRSPVESQLLAHRGSAGWSSEDITTANEAATGIKAGHGTEYRFFSTDLARAALTPEGFTPLSPQATEATPYLRQPGGEYEPLVNAGNVPEGTKFGHQCDAPMAPCPPEVISATPDLRHIVLKSGVPLVEGTTKAGLYEWSDGALQLLDQIPSGTKLRCGGAGQACVAAASATLGNESSQVRGAISNDGSRVVFGSSTKLFLRDLTSEETIQLDVAQAGCGSCSSGGATFQLASPDGSRIFFTDPNPLTAVSGNADLYECAILEAEGELSCQLTDLTPKVGGESAAVQGTVIGAAEDGSSLYFVAKGALSTQPNPEGESAQAGQPNLYRYDAATQSTRLIAVLAGADSNDWLAGNDATELGNLTSRVSPDGRWLAFMSQRPLTGYDNRDALSGERDEEVFLYDAGQGSLVCASCNPSGARPLGRQIAPGLPRPLIDTTSLWDGSWLAASIPGWTHFSLSGALSQSRYLSNSGRLLFNAQDALVPADSNGTGDVYEFEPPQGTGQPASNDCTASSPGYHPASGGCISLISSGTSGQESAFLDASESGDDVFFLTASRLSAKDEDAAYDIYDARVGGGEPEVVKPVECSGDACQQPAVPPNDATPGSLTFNGAGNLLECPKDQQRKGGKCVGRKAKKKHSKPHKKKHAHKRTANNSRRTSR
ncbi:MAG TPA: hypothetical protein VGO13_00970 [Solirubrobacterales bacterium]|nr:hypothetical protein [Solirubrobacterales bacterium]